MICKGYRGIASKRVSENKEYLDKEERESREIAKKFKKSTKISKKS